MPIDKPITFDRDSDFHNLENEILMHLKKSPIAVSPARMEIISVRAREYIEIIGAILKSEAKVVEYLISNKKLDLLRALHMACVLSINEHLEYLSAAITDKIYDVNSIKQFYRMQNIRHAHYNPAIGEPIPKIIHLIWLGSDIKIEHYKNLISWKVYNSDHVVNLWIDKALLVGGEHGSDYESIQEFANLNGLKLRDVGEVTSSMTDANVYYDNVIGEDRNWGLASNILRFTILGLEGGIYADTDIQCLDTIGDLYPTRDIMSFYINRAYGDSGHLLNDNVLAAIRGSQTMIIVEQMITYNYHRRIVTSLSATQNRSHRHGDVLGTIKWFGPRVLGDAYIAANYPEIPSTDHKSIKSVMLDCSFPMDKVSIGFDNSWFTRDKYPNEISSMIACQALQSIDELTESYLDTCYQEELNHLLAIKSFLLEINIHDPRRVLQTIDEYITDSRMSQITSLNDFLRKLRPFLSDNVLELNRVLELQNFLSVHQTESEAINFIEYLSNKVFIEHKLIYAIPLLHIFQHGITLVTLDEDEDSLSDTSILKDDETATEDGKLALSKSTSLHDYASFITQVRENQFGISSVKEMNIYFKFLQYPIVFNFKKVEFLERVESIRKSATKVLEMRDSEFIDAESFNEVNELCADATLALTLCEQFDTERLKSYRNISKPYTMGP